METATATEARYLDFLVTAAEHHSGWDLPGDSASCRHIQSIMEAEDLEVAYRRVLGEAAIPFVPIIEPADWHLRIFFLPSFLPETVFDVDHRSGATMLYRCRFQQSVWTILCRAKGQVVPLTSERAAAKLPEDHALVRLVTDEHVFRMADEELVTLDGDLYAVQLTYCGGVAEFEADANNLSPGWRRILDALVDAAKNLPSSSRDSS